MKRLNLCDINVSYKNFNSSNLSKLISWNSLYVFNDIKIIDFINYNIELYIYFENKFHQLNFNIQNKKLCLEQHNVKLDDLLNNLLDTSLDFIDFLSKLSTCLNNINPSHKSYFPSKRKTEEKPNENDIFIWNPFNKIKNMINNKYNYENFKNSAFTYYSSNNIEFKDLKTSKEHIIEIIIKELKLIEKNNFEMLFDNNNIFDFDVILSNFDNNELDDIILNIKLNAQLYPYYPPNISFKLIFDNNLNSMISNLKYFNKDTWNPTNNLVNMIFGIKEIINKYGIIKNHINKDFKKLHSIIQNITNNNNIKFKCNEVYNFELDFIKLSDNEDNKHDNLYWQSGVGYGTSGRTNWNINKYIKDNLAKCNFNLLLLDELYDEILLLKDNTEFKSFVFDTNLFLIFSNLLEGVNMIEFDKNVIFYDKLINIIDTLNFLEWQDMPVYEINLIKKNINTFVSEIITFRNLNINNNEEGNNITILDKYDTFFKKLSEKNTLNDIVNYDDEYIELLKDHLFNDTSFNNYEFKNHKDITSEVSRQMSSKVTKELSTFRTSLPLNKDSSIFVRYNQNDIRKLKALIIGPKGTPYENGTFIFDIFIPNDYPNIPPNFKLITTGCGTVRFNPNLYNSGKVCLSLLNTWNGYGGEKWNKDTSTILQVLISIQSLIFVENPFFNEPGYERNMNNDKHKILSTKYSDNIRYQNIKWAMYENLINIPQEFENVIKIHFKYKKTEIIDRIGEWYNESNLPKREFNDINNNLIKELNKL